MIQQGPLRLLFSFLGPKDSFISGHEIIKKKMEKRVLYLSGYFLLDRGNDFESGMENRLRAQGLFFSQFHIADGETKKAQRGTHGPVSW